MKLHKFILILLLVTLSIFPELSTGKKVESTDNKKLDIILKDYANNSLSKKDEDGGYITAISLTAQCQNNKAVAIVAGTNGIQDLTPIKENSIFQIGSITKAFISIVILQIAEENNISIDDTSIMKKWFPEYPKWSNITLRQLMNMTSGIPGNGNNLPDDIFKKFTFEEYTNKIDPLKILNLTYQLPLHFKPGTQFEYSNTNYTLLGRFIKKITHNEPEAEVAKRIIHKLKLSNTYFPVDKESDIPGIPKEQLVHGYAFQPKSSHPYPYMPYGADTLSFSLSDANTGGAMISTPHDINIFLHAIFAKDGMFNPYLKQLSTLVSRKTGQPLKFPMMTDRQGFGLGVIGYYWDKAHPFIYIYNGATDGFNFVYIIDPKTQSYLTYALNSRAAFGNLENTLDLFRKIGQSCSSSSPNPH